MDTEVSLERLQSEIDELGKSKRDIERLIQRKKLLMLKALPGIHGFDSMDALILALAQFASGDLRQRIGDVQPASPRSGKRRSYPAELRVAVRKALEAGESASQIARMKGISLATIMKWKKPWGLDSQRGGRRRTGARLAVEGPAVQGSSAEATASPAQRNGSAESWAL